MQKEAPILTYWVNAKHCNGRLNAMGQRSGVGNLGQAANPNVRGKNWAAFTEEGWWW